MSVERFPENSKEYVEGQGEKDRGGWLLVFQLVVILELIVSVIAVFLLSTMPILTLPLIIYGIIDIIILFAVSNKKEDSPTFIMNLLILTIVVRVLMFFVFMGMVGPMMMGQNFLIALVLLALNNAPTVGWYFYFRDSERVRATFRM